MASTSQKCSPATSPVPPATRSHPHRLIRPLNDRESIQRNFVTLPQRAANFSGRPLTLNERFGIIERGYFLDMHPDDVPTELDEPRDVTLVPLQTIPTREEIIADLLEATMKRKEKEAKRVTRSSISPPLTNDSSSSSP